MNGVLRDMLDRGAVVDRDGKPRPYHSGVTRRQAEILTEIAQREGATTVVEVGLAMGTSALAMLDGMHAHESNGQRLHVAVDPFQSTEWDSIGVINVERAGYATAFRLCENFDHVALPRLLAEGIAADVVFVDGWHTFDRAFLDIWYADMLLRPGGILGVHDYPMPGVQKAVAALLACRDYAHCPEYADTRPIHRRIASAAAHVARHANDPSQWTTSPARASTSMAVLRKGHQPPSDNWSLYRRF